MLRDGCLRPTMQMPVLVTLVPAALRWISGSRTRSRLPLLPTLARPSVTTHAKKITVAAPTPRVAMLVTAILTDAISTAIARYVTLLFDCSSPTRIYSVCPLLEYRPLSKRISWKIECGVLADVYGLTGQHHLLRPGLWLHRRQHPAHHSGDAVYHRRRRST
jgi:hypothetical protein